jgi:type 1 fimbria pilin
MDFMQPVTVTAATITLTKDHAGTLINLSRAAGITVTLPAATGTGRWYKLFTLTTVTSNSNIVKVANATDVMQGVAILGQDSADTAVLFEAGATADTITMNGSTTGGLRGDLIELQDAASGVWQVKVTGAATGTEATPFSATVS